MTFAARLTDGLGKFEMRLSVSELSTLEEIYVRKATGVFSERLGVHWCRFRMSDLVVPQFGSYQVVLTADGEFLGHCPLSVVKG